MFSDTFAGIRPSSTPAFILAQALGGVLAVAAIKVLYPHMAVSAADVVVPHHVESTDGSTTATQDARP